MSAKRARGEDKNHLWKKGELREWQGKAKG
jgi:hypothetical protein